MARIVRRGLKPKDFAKALMHEANVLFPNHVRAVHIGIAFAVYRGIALTTPVLTGRARKNWFVTTVKPSGRAVDPDQRITDEAHWFSVTGEPLNAEEKAMLDVALAKIATAPVGQRFYVTNNLRYIQSLEDGIGSRKAPTGMVEITLDHTMNQPNIARLAKGWLL